MINKILCWLFGHKEKEIRHTYFYGSPPGKEPLRSISTFKCTRCNNIRTYIVDYKKEQQ